VEELGSLKEGTRADITVIDPREKEVVATFVKGEMVAFAGRIIRKGYGAGGWVTRCGILDETGIGDLARVKYV
jgi:cytosine/adenosine deaminase-related metal-dependent hydrolase